QILVNFSQIFSLIYNIHIIHIPQKFYKKFTQNLKISSQSLLSNKSIYLGFYSFCLAQEEKQAENKSSLEKITEKIKIFQDKIFSFWKKTHQKIIEIWKQKKLPQIEIWLKKEMSFINEEFKKEK
ncbi:MAG: hypothetical protein V1649_00105, partial [Patescibacteria group bacterium]